MSKLSDDLLESSNKWSKEISDPTELSKGMTLTEIDEQSADLYRQYKSELNKPKASNNFVQLQNEAKKSGAESFIYKDKKYIKKITETGLIYYKKSFWS